MLTDAGLTRPASIRRVRLRDHETVVAARGESGPAVVLLHALGLDRNMWEPVMERLAIGRRVYAYDLRGHGRAAGSPAPFTMDDIAADLIAALDALELEQAHVVGLSYGGGVAQTAAVRDPGRFASLALLANHRLSLRRLRGPGALGRNRRHGGAGRPEPDPLVHARGPCRQRLERALRA
jgi:3-oxoadipate enol-lactonase